LFGLARLSQAFLAIIAESDLSYRARLPIE
jgi:hypothetical protein